MPTSVGAKRMAAQAEIFFICSSCLRLISGMNFTHMPELHWTFGYPLAIGGMIGLGGIFYWLFKRVGWL